MIRVGDFGPNEQILGMNWRVEGAQGRVTATIQIRRIKRLQQLPHRQGSMF